MSEQESTTRIGSKIIRTETTEFHRKEESGNPRPAKWPAPPQDKVIRVTKGVITPKPKPS